MSDNTVFRFKDDDNSQAEPDKEACLIMIDGDFLGEVYDLNKDVIMVGRTDDVDIMLADIGVSRHHVLITRQHSGYFIADMGSTNGTQVNGDSVLEPRQLRDGDKIRISETMFKFSYQDADDTEYHRQLRALAIKDGLTRIFNKRYFHDAIKKEFGYCTRNHARLSLIIFDIDNFKDLNDKYGHPAGDYILKNLAALISNEARDYDTFARFGGEEFVFLLRGSDLQSSVVFAERIRNIVQQKQFSYDDQILQVTISLGVATFDGNTSMKDQDELVAAADKQLYQAKQSGRNKTCYEINDSN